MHTKNIADFSDWQDGINFDLLKNNFDGVIFKLAEGTKETACWAKYKNEAEKRGMPWGVYVYARARDEWDAEDEALNAYALLKSERAKPDLGVWYDIEDPSVVGENGGAGIGADAITACASNFISTLNGEGYSAGIYAPFWVIRDRIYTNLLAAYVPYWVSASSISYSTNPLLKSGLKNKDGGPVACAGWQDRVDGANGVSVGAFNVDGSVWYR